MGVRFGELLPLSGRLRVRGAGPSGVGVADWRALLELDEGRGGGRGHMIWRGALRFDAEVQGGQVWRGRGAGVWGERAPSAGHPGNNEHLNVISHVL